MQSKEFTFLLTGQNKQQTGTVVVDHVSTAEERSNDYYAFVAYAAAKMLNMRLIRCLQKRRLRGARRRTCATRGTDRLVAVRAVAFSAHAPFQERAHRCSKMRQLIIYEGI